TDLEARLADPSSAAPVAEECLIAWQRVFRDQDLIRLQHQISALSTALDDAYYDRHPGLKRPGSEDGLVHTNPDLPSEAIRAVKHSIDYWQRTVEWIADHHAAAIKAGKEGRQAWPGQGDMLWWKDMRLALTEQANIWQTLM